MIGPQQDKGLLARIRTSVKYLIRGSVNGSPFYFGQSDYHYGTTIDYRQRAGELMENSIVGACVGWITKNFPQPVRTMRNIAGPAKDEEDERHPLTQLLRMPNKEYSGELLMRATALSLSLANNAFWIVWFNSADQPVELWYEPHHTIRLVYSDDPDPNTPFVDHYEVYRRGQWLRMERENVIHFRDSLDPRNPRMGLFMLGAALREVYTDNEAAAYTATMLQNMGVPGMIVSPKGDGQINDPQGLKKHLMASIQGDHRGEPIVLSIDANIDIPAFNPEQMQIETARNLPEERIAAILGPGLVIAAGLGAGLDKGTFQNYDQAVASAYRNNIMPMQRIVAAQINTTLLPKLGNAANEYVEFDLSEVPELQEDRNALSKRITEAVKVGMPIYANEMREANGLPPIDALKEKWVEPPPYILRDPFIQPDEQPAQLPAPAEENVPAQLPPGKALVVTQNGHSDN